jgi:peptidoglycan hydrolase CwlO-like protein
MIKWMKRLFRCNKIDDLHIEISMLKNKISEKQEQINKTNAYYKRIIRDMKNSQKKSS